MLLLYRSIYAGTQYLVPKLQLLHGCFRLPAGWLSMIGQHPTQLAVATPLPHIFANTGGVAMC